MSVTQQLLELYRVDKQLRDLRSRLDAAERFLKTQTTQLGEMERQRGVLDTQLKQLKASIANNEGEVARLDAKMAHIREQMNSAKTAKEYNAYLTELNTYKDQRGQYEERVLEGMTKAEEVEKTLGAINAQFGERAGIVQQAKTDRDARETEIRDSVTRLQGERDQVAAGVPPRERETLEQLIRLRGDEAMAPIEVIDRRAHEYNCSACMMAITVEVVSAVLSGKVAVCPSCRCMLYADEASRTAEDPVKPKKAPRVSKKKAGAKANGKKDADAAADAGSESPDGADAAAAAG